MNPQGRNAVEMGSQQAIPGPSTTASNLSSDKGGGQPGVAGDEPSETEGTVSRDAQAGVKRIQAIASVWTKNHLIAAYVL